MWGSSPANLYILIDGKRFWIRENLRDALRRIRRTAQVVRLWTDAICIDQENQLERNAQVQRMGETYSGADETLIWLGNGSPNSTSLRDLCDMLKSVHVLSREQIAMGAPSIIEVFSQSWFSRLWVLQEAVLAKKATMILGSEECDLTLLHTLGTGIGRERITMSLARTDGIMALIEKMLLFSDMIVLRSTPNLDFQEMVATCQSRACQDPRDHVFGLVGMARLLGFEAQAVDYALDVREVYQTFMHNALIGSLNQLIAFETGVEDSNPLHLPSWVPDLSHKRLARRFITHHYLAGGAIELGGLSESSFSLSEGTMRLCGFQFDSVRARRICLMSSKTLQEFYQSDDGSITLKIHALAAEEIWYDDLADRSPYGNRQGQIEACWRTLIGNIYRHFHPNVNGVLAVELFASFGNGLYDMLMDRAEWPMDDESRLDRLVRFIQSEMASNRSVLLTRGGYYGLGPIGTLEEDIIVVIPGLSMPIVVRKQPNSDRYRLLGPAYVHGIMKGEYMEQILQTPERRPQTYIFE